MINKCPGQDDRNIKSESIKCPDCGYEIEIFSDEIKVRCPKCKHMACRVRLPACIDWCKHAKKCIGEEKWKELRGG
ncbi:MAG: phosphohydrolase [Candidatus Omnitrophica bacterium]|nr:phosphohydrolase [Candidatus Omnitrophota bacterium]